MKRVVSVEQTLCDVCQKNEAHPWAACLKCGKMICYDCRTLNAHEYAHGVNVGGSGDGIYCNECDATLTKTGNDLLHNAYRAILALKNEVKGFSTDFDKRRTAAEAALKNIQGK